jgi:hypothetical protein
VNSRSSRSAMASPVPHARAISKRTVLLRPRLTPQRGWTMSSKNCRPKPRPDSGSGHFEATTPTVPDLRSRLAESPRRGTGGQARCRARGGRHATRHWSRRAARRSRTAARASRGPDCAARREASLCRITAPRPQPRSRPPSRRPDHPRQACPRAGARTRPVSRGAATHPTIASLRSRVASRSRAPRWPPVAASVPRIPCLASKFQRFRRPDGDYLQTTGGLPCSQP